MLKSQVVKISEISNSQIEEMFNLMQEVYFGVGINKFKKDLSEKDYVLILYDEKLRGFTTIQVFNFRGKKIIYSGDTVISAASRGEIELMRAWWRFSYKIQQENPGQDVYWLLISKGWRTYKFFPLFLKEFCPNKSAKTPPDVQEFIDALGAEKFGKNYKDGI